VEDDEARKRREENWNLCQDLATHPNILDLLESILTTIGVAGERTLAKLLYLAITSRFLDQLISVAVKGPSSGGKSYLVGKILALFPESAYYILTSMSEMALAYMEESLSHRMLIIYEANGMHSDMASYLIRSLLSEGCIRHQTVDKSDHGLKGKTLYIEGPTGLIVTTTEAALHPENETRLLSLTVNDTPEQTKEILLAIAQDQEIPPDLSRWHSLQTWYELGEHRVVIPFARALAVAIPPSAVRLRRDFKMILGFIKAHAILHQYNRLRDPEGKIIASLHDYAVVRELVASFVAEGIGATVSATVRATVEGVAELLKEDQKEVSVSQLAQQLQLCPSSTSRRAKTAIELGFIGNLEDKKGKSARLVLGDPLPEDQDILPKPEDLNRCSVAHENGGIKTSIPVVTEPELVVDDY